MTARKAVDEAQLLISEATLEELADVLARGEQIAAVVKGLGYVYLVCRNAKQGMSDCKYHSWRYRNTELFILIGLGSVAIRDGSTGDIVDGYWLCQVIGVENEAPKFTDAAIVPLYSALYSQKAPDFQSENEEIKTAFSQVAAACDGRGVWVVDRGGDRRELYTPRLAGAHSFIIHNTGERHVLAGRRKVETAALAAQCPMIYATHIVREEKGREVCCRLDYGFRPVRLPEHPDVPLWLVVVRGLGEKPMMLLTNLSLRKNRKVLWWVVSAYLSRWRIEEAIRFIKQSYDFEDIRVLSYERLRNMAVLLNAVAFFTAVVLGTRIKLEILATHLLKAAKRLFGIPDFRLYALADGIREVCARSPRRAQPGAKDPPQLTLGFGEDFLGNVL